MDEAKLKKKIKKLIYINKTTFLIFHGDSGPRDTKKMKKWF